LSNILEDFFKQKEDPFILKGLSQFWTNNFQLMECLTQEFNQDKAEIGL
jgi:hypothetical protein